MTGSKLVKLAIKRFLSKLKFPDPWPPEVVELLFVSALSDNWKLFTMKVKKIKPLSPTVCSSDTVGDSDFLLRRDVVNWDCHNES